MTWRMKEETSHVMEIDVIRENSLALAIQLNLRVL